MKVATHPKENLAKVLDFTGSGFKFQLKYKDGSKKYVNKEYKAQVRLWSNGQWQGSEPYGEYSSKDTRPDQFIADALFERA